MRVFLQNHFELQLANPRHIKNIPEKNDTKDAEWIARLTRLRVVTTSFVTPITHSRAERLNPLSQTFSGRFES